jgi:hypothetical protein
MGTVYAELILNNAGDADGEKQVYQLTEQQFYF